MVGHDRIESDVRVLLVPGGGGSGPQHWHTYWQSADGRAETVVQAEWNGGTRAQWVAALDRHVRSSNRPTVLIPHSLGNIVVSHWAATATDTGTVYGALLVAPADIDADWAQPGSLYRAFRPIPMKLLPFPTVLVASTNDPYLSMSRARDFAAAWGSRLEVVGPLGHIGSDAKLETWEAGQRLLDEIIRCYAPVPHRPSE